jgi:phosphoribosylamine--glycine ligase
MKSLIIGQGSREGILSKHMASSSKLYAVMKHINPTIKHFVDKSGGKYCVADPCDAKAVCDFAIKNRIDVAMVSSDNPLEVGIVDRLTEVGVGIPTIGPTKAGSEIEWNKAFSRRVVSKNYSDANPFFKIIRSDKEFREVVSLIKHTPIVIKPTGLTGGKGVKVMGVHLHNHNEAWAYAKKIMEKHGSFIVEERIDGIEFTIQAITDGISTFFSPPTYDYPYRFNNDKGPGTGGMGGFLHEEWIPPFISKDEYDTACRIINNVLMHLYIAGRKFNGVLNGGFFISKKGLKVIEFNARFGDPECLNVMGLFEGDWCDLMSDIWSQRFDPSRVMLRRGGSVVVYLVTPEYASGKPSGKYRFGVDIPAVEDSDCQVYFSSAIKKGDLYETIGISRVLAVMSVSDDCNEARRKVYSSIKNFVSGDVLDCRSDIASANYIKRLVDWKNNEFPAI